jgi:rhodanese-related sulfurtransferase
MEWKVWIPWVAVAAVVAGWFILQRSRLVSPAQARELLRQGAKVLDVRTPQEFAARRLPGVTNLPLDELTTRLAREVPDKNTALLLHCQSGARSGLAARTLKGLGYSRVFNLGSLARAEAILQSARQ